jgi:hypothetical protein
LPGEFGVGKLLIAASKSKFVRLRGGHRFSGPKEACPVSTNIYGTGAEVDSSCGAATLEN